MLPHQIDSFLKSIPEDQILGIEAKHITYCNSSKDPFNKDMLVVKEVVHLKNGQSYPRLGWRENYKRPYYITKKAYRNHKEKKQQELLFKLDKYETLQCKLTNEIAKRLGKKNSSLKQLAYSPYLYGCDIKTETLLKKEYQDRWPDMFKANKVAVLDFETDMLEGNGRVPIIGSVTFKEKAITCVLKSWVDKIPDFVERLKREMDKAIGVFIKKRNTDFIIKVCDTPADLCLSLIDKLHEWQPDIVGIWNIDFDINVFIETLTAANVDLGTVFSDPRVPEEYKYFEYKKGITIKPKDNKDSTDEKLAPADQWHTVYTPASFYFIDAMCVYRQIRKANGREKYDLDSVMDKNLNIGKLYYEFNDVGPIGTVDWHIDMQRKHRIEYIVYNQFDCIGVEMLDEVTNDLNTQLSMFSGYSHYSIFNSNPKQTSNELHFLCLDLEKLGYGAPKVISSLSANMVHPLDDLLLGKEENIVTLPSYTIMMEGLCMIKEFPQLRSYVIGKMSDADLSATYPTGNIIQNLDGETQMVEVAKVERLTPTQQRELALDITAGPANALSIMIDCANFPHPDKLVESMRRKKRAISEAA